MTVLTAGTVVALDAQPAQAAVASIVCGGVKHGTGWRTNSTGGYVGQGCGAGIDFVVTPTSATSTYYFGYFPIEGGSAHLQAYIPTLFASANMNWDVFICGLKVHSYVYNENNYRGQWVDLGYWGATGSCEVRVTAWSGMASQAYMGLDAVRNIA